jgi:hypothetical protein
MDLNDVLPRVGLIATDKTECASPGKAQKRLLAWVNKYRTSVLTGP